MGRGYLPHSFLFLPKNVTMPTKLEILLSMLIVLILAACTKKNDTTNKLPIAIIPQSATLIEKPGNFTVTATTKILTEKDNSTIQNITDYLATHFETAAGFRLSVDKYSEKGDNAIVFLIDDKIEGEEAYTLEVTPKKVVITAAQPAGLFYGVQSLLQLLPTQIYAATISQNIKWTIPAVEIKDQPKFSYRGLHLDVGRHFFGVQDIKKFIDGLALHKMNTFHWHLTEDQGWRIEIKKYPKLTEIGGYRNGTLIGHYSKEPQQFDGIRYGGFYTQEEIKEVVQYAQERFITVIPEIELPGHAQAAITAYPALGCTDESLEVMQTWGVSDNVFCPTEETFEFLENVLTEVIDLFPSKYIHIGGDECPKIQWEESEFAQNLIKKEGLKDEHGLQSYFIARMEKFINSKGRSIIGWDEILEGGLAPNATVMSWRGTEGGITAAKQGHDVIMTPTDFCYLDYYQSDYPDEPLAIGGLVTLEKVYSYHPIPEELTPTEAKHILGVQGNLWTEYIPTYEQVEYMVYPRATALAEVGWSSRAKDYPDFVSRLSHHLNRLKSSGINTANHLYELSLTPKVTKEGTTIKLKLAVSDAKIYYTTDGSAPTAKANLYNGAIPFSKTAVLKAQAFANGQAQGRILEKKIAIHQAVGKSITLSNQPAPKYAASGNTALINGITAAETRFNDGEWLGFNGVDFESVIDFGKATTVKKVQLGFFNDANSWIYLPNEVVVFGSTDGNHFEKIGGTKEILGTEKVVPVSVVLEKSDIQYLKVVAKNYGAHPTNGGKTWLFVDEVVVE